MKPAARIQAAIEVLDDILLRHRSAALALSDWGRSHRFAGSGDRSAIGNLVFDALRRRRSIAARFSSDTSRALALGAARTALGLSTQDVASGCDGTRHAPPPLNEAERAALDAAIPDHASPAERADVPDWLWPSFQQAFGTTAEAEGAALAERAPVDLRVNTLLTDRASVLAALSRYKPAATSLSPTGIRIEAPRGGERQANVESEAAHGRGWFEVQDEGSQIAALMSGAVAGEAVLDLCAGAGGKSLAMAAAMAGRGRIVAYDEDKRRLRPIFERLSRAQAAIVEVLDGGDEQALAALGPVFDRVLVDAPCTGTGTWRRRPDTKWRLKPQSLSERIRQQAAVLATAARHVKPGGSITYVTCSVLPEENTTQVSSFLARFPQFALRPWRDVWRSSVGTPPTESADGSDATLLMTPARHGTDGFFVAHLTRRP